MPGFAPSSVSSFLLGEIHVSHSRRVYYLHGEPVSFILPVNGRNEAGVGTSQPPLASTSQYDPFTRSRTLFFLSIRDSRPRRRRNGLPNAPTASLAKSKSSRSGQGTATDAFVIYDEEEEEEDAENARLLGNAAPLPVSAKKGHVALEMDEPVLPPAWYVFRVPPPPSSSLSWKSSAPCVCPRPRHLHRGATVDPVHVMFVR